MRLSELLKDGCALTLSGTTSEECLREIAEALLAKGRIADADSAVNALLAREGLRSTAMGNMVAVPHAQTSVSGGNIALAIGYHPQGLDFASPDGEKVHIFFTLLLSPDGRSRHLNTLAQIAKLIKMTDFAERLMQADKPVYDILTEEEKKLA